MLLYSLLISYGQSHHHKGNAPDRIARRFDRCQEYDGGGTYSASEGGSEGECKGENGGTAGTGTEGRQTKMIFQKREGGPYYYEFEFNGARIRESTKQKNANLARTMEAARRTQLAKGEVGLKDKPKVPTLKEFEPRFDAFIESECNKPGKEDTSTLKWYRERMKRLLDYPALADCPLDQIGAEKIGKFKTDRGKEVTRLGRPPAVSSINGELRTLRRLLKVAEDWKIIGKPDTVKMAPGENQRDFVMSYAQERDYIHVAPQPLADIAVLMLEESVRPEEAAEMQWPNVHLEPAHNAALGYVHIPFGKTKNSKRNLSLTALARAMLIRRFKAAAPGVRYVFPNDETGGPFLVSSLDHMHADLREDLLKKWKGTPLEVKAAGEFVLYSLRHTSLTRFGESGAGAFEIMKHAGHANITTSQRYVHPTPEGQERATSKMDEMNRQRRAELAEVPPKVPPVGNLTSPEKRRKSNQFKEMGA